MAATPIPNPPSVSNSPEPQKGGSTITFSSNAQPGAPGELIKLLICKTNSNLCVLGSQWGYRRAITISNSGSSVLTDYQVNITLNTASLISAGKMRSDCGDIRFADTSGNLINYWIESGCNTTSTKIWVKVPNIPASSSTTIYVYYGNPSATSLSNPNNVFVFFENFDPSKTWTLSGKWHYTTFGVGAPASGNVLRYGDPNINSYDGVANSGNADSPSFNLPSGCILEYVDKSATEYSGFTTSPAYDKEFIYISTDGGATWTQISIYSGTWDWTSRRINISSYSSTNAKIRFRFDTVDGIANNYYGWAVDNIIIRKYTSPEPTTSIGSEEVLSASNFVYTQSQAVSSNPSATYTCPSCTYSQNTYYGVAYSVNESVWTAFTGAQTFTCKMEASQSGSCSCTSNTQCYNPCNVNWGSYYDGYCYNSKCYDAIPGSTFGLTQSCLAGTVLNHETSSGRYANVNGRLYYCKGSDNSVSPYPFVFNLSPGSSVGNCKCNQDGSWSCQAGTIPIRGGRIKIV